MYNTFNENENVVNEMSIFSVFIIFFSILFLVLRCVDCCFCFDADGDGGSGFGGGDGG